jgi:hypothetical protein
LLEISAKPNWASCTALLVEAEQIGEKSEHVESKISTPGEFCAQIFSDALQAAKGHKV